MMTRRCHPRARVNLWVKFCREGSESHTSGCATDLSLGGMFIATVAPQPFGARLVVALGMPGAPQPLVLQAVVRWTNVCGMGVEFEACGVHETFLVTQHLHDANLESVAPPSRRA
jgi:hypothetical protein